MMIVLEIGIGIGIGSSMECDVLELGCSELGCAMGLGSWVLGGTSL